MSTKRVCDLKAGDTINGHSVVAICENGWGDPPEEYLLFTMNDDGFIQRSILPSGVEILVDVCDDKEKE